MTDIEIEAREQLEGSQITQNSNYLDSANMAMHLESQMKIAEEEDL